VAEEAERRKEKGEREKGERRTEKGDRRWEMGDGRTDLFESLQRLVLVLVLVLGPSFLDGRVATGPSTSTSTSTSGVGFGNFEIRSYGIKSCTANLRALA
jgi:hypothetical protein